MSEPTKPRFTVDLDEIDRQLRRSTTSSSSSSPSGVVSGGQTQGAADYSPAFHPSVEAKPQPGMRPVAPPTGGQGGDPLQELARIVGQEDPFQSILGTPGAAPYPRPAPGASLYAPAVGNVSLSPAAETPARPPIGSSPEVGTLSEYLRSENERAAGIAAQPSYQPYSRQQGAPAQEDGLQDIGAQDLDAQDLDALAAATRGAPGSYVDPATYHGSETTDYAPSRQPYDRDYTPSYADPKLGYQPGYDDAADQDYVPERSSRRKLFLAGGVAVLAVVLGVGGYGFMRNTGFIGSSEPPLVTASSEPTKVAPEAPGGKEFPDQNKQIYQNNAGEGSTQVVNREEQPVDIREATGARNGLLGSNAFGDARKVRTVVIRPDGTSASGSPTPASGPAVGTRSPAPAPAPAPVSSAPNTAARGATSTPESAVPPPAQATQPTQPEQPPQAAQPAVTPPQRPAATSSPRQASASPAPAARPSQQPETTAPVQGGAYVVQFGVSGSEAEGRSRFNRLKGQFPSILGGVSPSIRAAEVNGRTVYRIRTGGMSKDASDSLCSNLKAAGGDCFVVRN